MSSAISQDFTFLMPASPGLSNDAKEIVDKIGRNKGELRNMRAISLVDTLNFLQKLLKETSKDDWDGYGAAAIPTEAFEEALTIIDLLPSSIPIPEIAPEPDGDLGLEWYCGERRVFVASVSGNHRINYAGIFGDNKTHGTEYFEESLPPILMVHLKRLYYQ